MAGNKVYVILNRAGGYRRGLVLIRNLQVFDVIFDNPQQKPEPVPTPPVPPKPDNGPAETDEEEEIPEDYGLIAFQWVEANMRKNGITDGTCGMRSLIDWITSTEITGDVYRSALSTIISKATSDEEDREALKTTILDPIFTPSRRKAS